MWVIVWKIAVNYLLVQLDSTFPYENLRKIISIVMFHLCVSWRAVCQDSKAHSKV